MLCDWCKWAIQAEILARRPELRVPIGTGTPIAPTDPEIGYPLLECGTCGGHWWGTPLEPCRFCEYRQADEVANQTAANQRRFLDLCSDLRNGDLTNLAEALTLSLRLGTSQALVDALMAPLVKGR